ncbi:vomeronasal type-2 receptor 26-like [Dendrobates tinctorius]|uniref:vomeronasal type-2 receptor 26-like n=1 Tax=Dendrobates tinctorius TaxID=92724 RepID=UPI003CCA386D
MLLLLCLFLQLFPVSSSTEACELRGDVIDGYYREGDLMIGGIIQVNTLYIPKKLTFTSRPKPLRCDRPSLRFYRYLMIFFFTFQEINNNLQFLPNISLGYQIFDSCANVHTSVYSVLRILSGKKQIIPNYSCWNRTHVVGFIGDLTTTSSYAVAQLAGIYRYPQISYGSMTSLFRTSDQFPTFYQAAANELCEIDAIVQLVKYFHWKWVGILVSDDDTGRIAGETFKMEILRSGGCVAFFIEFKENLSGSLKSATEMIETIDKSSANVTIAFLSINYADTFVHMFAMPKLRPKMWIMSSFFSRVSELQRLGIRTTFNGSLSLAGHQGDIPGFRDYLYSVKPIKYPDDDLLRKIWEMLIMCTYSNTTSDVIPKCMGNESLNDELLSLFNVFVFRTSYVVYTSIYIMANSLQNMYGTGKSKNTKTYFQHWRVPPSICNEACKPGHRKAKREGEPPCCYDCVRCAKGEMSNTTDSQSCLKCFEYENSNVDRSGCVPKDVDFLSYGDIVGATLTSVSILFFIMTSVILGIFWRYRETPIVKANNRILSYILLISIALCFMCTLLFIGRPSQVSCLLQQAAFGIVFTVSISSVLAKTLTVIIAFKATQPGSKVKKLLGSRISITFVFLCSLGEILLSVLWIMFYPPYLDVDTEVDTVLLLCNQGSTTFFFLNIGYIGLLALICLGAAFLAKDFPDRFNEAKNISFSILIFCSVWVTFVPTYLSVKGKNMVAVEVFAILTSSAGLMSFIFLPKCYYIYTVIAEVDAMGGCIAAIEGAPGTRQNVSEGAGAKEQIVKDVEEELFPVASSPEACELRGYDMDRYYREGDLMIGGIIQVNTLYIPSKLTFTARPKALKCGRPSLRFYRYLMIFFLTFEEINKNLQFPANISLGYRIFDSCANVHRSVCSVLRILSGKKQIIPNYSCWNRTHVVGFIGDLTTTSSYAVAQLAGIYRYPQVQNYSYMCIVDN